MSQGDDVTHVTPVTPEAIPACRRCGGEIPIAKRPLLAKVGSMLCRSCYAIALRDKERRRSQGKRR